MLEGMSSSKMSPRAGFRRLSGQDAAFLSFERAGRPMHIGAVAFFASSGWRDAEGGLDAPRLVRTLAARARAVPGMDQRLAKAPLSGWPIWVRDQSLNWESCFEVREPAACAEDVRAIAETAMAAQMDRTRPLWRVLVIPGLDGGETFALVFLVHHALVDGIAGVDLLARLLDPRQGMQQPGPAPHGPLPSARRMRVAEVARWLELPTVLALKAGALATNRTRSRRAIRRGAALVRTCVRLLTPGPKTALRGRDEGVRNVAWFSFEEQQLRLARKRLDGTPNDIVLAAVAQAISQSGGGGSYLPFRKLRAAVPVSFRTRAQRYELGNRIGLLLTPLEVHDRNAGRSVAQIRRHTALQKRRGDAEGYEVLTELTAWTGQWSQRLLHWLAGTLHSYGILVTNVPGPTRPYTLGGAELREIYPLVPLFGSQSVSVAVIRYRGAFRVGVTSCWASREMVDQFALNLQAAFVALTRATVEADAASEAAPGGWAPFPGLFDA
jgi:WS/DGAT/MGAT family acyltransferase